MSVGVISGNTYIHTKYVSMHHKHTYTCIYIHIHTYMNFHAVDAMHVYWKQQYPCIYMHIRAYTYIYLLLMYIFRVRVALTGTDWQSESRLANLQPQAQTRKSRLHGPARPGPEYQFSMRPRRFKFESGPPASQLEVHSVGHARRRQLSGTGSQPRVPQNAAGSRQGPATQ